ncbi:MAG: hypothetical protein EA423_01890, partial [Phycisphaerales bacterium]
IQGAGGNNWARFNVLSGGQIDLGSLESTSGRVRFRVENPAYSLPSLTATAGTSLFSVADGTELTLPALASMSGATLQIDDGGTIEAPMLASFTNGFVDINPARFLFTPDFQDVTNSRFFVRSGATFDRVAAASYTGNFGQTNTDVFLATDAGSVLDLSSLSSLSLPSGAGGTTITFAVTASNGGRIDLSNLTTIQGAGGNNWARFNVLSGGQMQIGAESMTGRVMFRADGTSSILRFLGSVRLVPSVDLQLLGVSTMSVAGNFLFEHTNASTLRLSDGVLHMNGSGAQKLEVGGADLGLPSGSIDPNFQIGQLVVGDADQSTAVVLVDMNDNGNRGPNAEPEALYLQGFPSDDGLRVLGGSTLYLNGLDAYAVIAGDWIHLNALVPAGQTRVDFDGGWIDLGAPFECIADINGDGVVDADDFFLFLQFFASGDPKADINCDGIIDADDFFAYLALFAAGC